MGAVRIQPECGQTCRLGPVDAQFDPIQNRRLVGRGRAPDVALFDIVFGDHIAVGQFDADGARSRGFKRGGVRAVFLGFLRHQADVGHGTAGCDIQFSGFFEIVDGFVVDARIAIVGDAAFGVRGLAIGAPADAACADHSRHGGVDDHIGRHMQVGDALIGIHHIHRGFGRHRGFQGGFQFGVACNAVFQIADAGIRVPAQCGDGRAVRRKEIIQIGRDEMAENDRVRDLHHCRLEVDGKQHAGLHVGQFGLGEITQCGGGHESGINDGALGVVQPVFQHGFGAIRSGQHDFRATGLCGGDGGGLFIGKEIIARHRRHMGFAVGSPFAHRMRVGLGVFLDRFGRATVRVALAQDGVHGRPFQAVIAFAHVFFGVGLRGFGVIGDGIALTLQFLDRVGQLRHRCRHVGQFDHIGGGGFYQLAQFGQIIGNLLIGFQVIGKGGQDARCDRNVAGGHVDIGGAGECADDRQQGCAGQFGGFVNDGIDDVGGFGLGHGLRILHPGGRNAGMGLRLWSRVAVFGRESGRTTAPSVSD